MSISYAVFCLKKKNNTIHTFTLLIKPYTMRTHVTMCHPVCAVLRDGTLLSNFVTCSVLFVYFLFFFNDTATTEIYTLSLHDALPICTFFQWLHTEPEGAAAQRLYRDRDGEPHHLFRR